VIVIAAHSWLLKKIDTTTAGWILNTCAATDDY